MLKALVFVKDIFAVLTPFVLIELYTRYIYNLSWVKVVPWWFKNHGEVESGVLGASIIAVFFALFAVWVTFGHMTQTAYLLAFGEDHKLIYLGNHAEGKSQLIQTTQRGEQEVIKTSYRDHYNYSFDTIYTQAIFEREQGTSRIGSAKEAYSLYTVVRSAVFLTLFSLILIAAIHALIHPVASQLQSLAIPSDMDALQSFDEIFRPLGGSVLRFSIAGFGILFLLAFVLIIAPSSEYGPRVKSLPSGYISQATVVGMPIVQKRKISTSRLPSGGTRDTDTGYRDTVFRFDQGFPEPVFVTLRYHQNDYPDAEISISQNIDQGRSMQLELTDQLMLKLTANK